MAEPTPEETEALGYAEALRELEDIVAELDREAVDVDHLSARVQRAAQLLRMLRQKISNARMEVAQVVAELDGAGDGGG